MLKRSAALVLVFVVLQMPIEAQPTKSIQGARAPMSSSDGGSVERVFEDLLVGTSCSVVECESDRYCRAGQGPSRCLLQACSEVSWRVCVQDRGLRGLWVGPVDLKAGKDEPWRNVLWEAGVADLLTNYHNGEHLPDMKFCSRCLRHLEQGATGALGTVLKLSGDQQTRLAVEIRDRGIGWLCTWQDQDGSERSRVRRSEEMVLWGVYDTGNYDFIMEYSFRDNGSIGFRLGATGYNNPGFPSDAHMHTALWRVDLDVDGYLGDTAKLLTHREGVPTPLEARDVELSFHGGREGSQAWIGQLFTTLLVEDSRVNAHGNHPGYELIPFTRGLARHRGPMEKYTQSDFWVTVWNQHESGYSPPNDWHINDNITPDSFLIEAAGEGGKIGPEPVVNEDLIVWYMAGEHHDPHDEDRSAFDQGAEPEGVTLVHWWGFDLVPHSFFEQSPLGSPHRTECGERP